MIPNGKFSTKVFGYSDLRYIFAVRKGGAIAQSVEQWTENPCVPGSIPGGTTSVNRKPRKINDLRGLEFKGVTKLLMDFLINIKSADYIQKPDVLTTFGQLDHN